MLQACSSGGGAESFQDPPHQRTHWRSVRGTAPYAFPEDKESEELPLGALGRSPFPLGEGVTAATAPPGLAESRAFLRSARAFVIRTRVASGR